ncbi:MAG TPA: hypothetical protein VEI57_09670 [Nitrospirota bacterium]|nr:hypothetical protein [Nitrospirota bacterium]
MQIYAKYVIIVSATNYVDVALSFQPALKQTAEAALKGIRNVMCRVVADMIHMGESIPEPLATNHLSGNCIVRVPPDVQGTLTWLPEHDSPSGYSLRQDSGKIFRLDRPWRMFQRSE